MATLASLFTGGEAGSSPIENAPTPKASEAPEATKRDPASSPTEHSEASSFGNSDGCLPDANVVADLRRRKEELEQKQKELVAKETELKAKEQALNEEFKKIDLVREDISKVDGARKKENDEKVNKLVETFETMSPKAAALLVASVDESLAVAAMAKMSTPKLAKIMNVMEPKRSSRLTELLAGVVRARIPAQSKGSSSDDEAVTTPAAKTAAESTKGGEKK